MKVRINEKKIRQKMIDMDIKTISDLSKQSGVSRPKIHEYLNGGSPFSTTLTRLCRFLEIEPEDIVMITGDNENGEKVDVSTNN